MFRVWSMFIRSPVPYGPPVQPVFTSQTGTSYCSRRSISIARVDARVARQERRPEAGRERRRRLLDADLGAGELGRVAADEVVGRLLAGQAARSAAGRRTRRRSGSTTLRGWPAMPVGSALPMKCERVGAAGVLGEPLGVEVELARRGVDVDVLEDRPEPARRREDVRLVHRREADRLGVAAALEVEDAVAPQPCSSSPMRLRSRIGREGRLARPRQAEEDDASRRPSPTLTDECIGSTPSSGIR